MSYTDARADRSDRPVTRRRYPSSTNNNTDPPMPAILSTTNHPLMARAPTVPITVGPMGLAPIHPQPMMGPHQPPQQPLAPTSSEMERYMAYMDLNQLLEHNLDALFPAAEDILERHQAAHNPNTAAYRTYLMEMEDGGLIGPNGTQIFAQMPTIDTRSQRSSRGSSRILRNFVLMDGRNSDTNGNNTSSRKPTIYHNTFSEFGSTGHPHGKPAIVDPFDVPLVSGPCGTADEIPSKWKDAVPCAFIIPDLFKEQIEAEKDPEENQRDFAKDLFYASMFYVNEEDETDQKLVQEDKSIRQMLRPESKYW